MKKRDKMKMMGILILLLAVITVAITLILVSRLSKTAGKDQKEETFDCSVSGMLSNAYILKRNLFCGGKAGEKIYGGCGY